MMIANSNSHTRWFGYLIHLKYMYFNENLVKFTYCLQLIDMFLKIGVCINNKMLIWLIHAGYKGINHCRKKKPIAYLAQIQIHLNGRLCIVCFRLLVHERNHAFRIDILLLDLMKR